MIAGTRILKAEDHGMFVRARELMARAQKTGEDTIAWADLAYKKAREQGYLDGLNAAQAEALQESLRLSNERTKSLEHLQNSVANVAVEVITRFLADVPSITRIQSLVRESLDTLAATHGTVRVVVAPEHAKELSTWLKQQQEDFPRLEFQIHGSSKITPNACRVEATGGTVEFDLQRQLDMITAVGNATSEAAPKDMNTEGHGHERIELN